MTIINSYRSVTDFRIDKVITNFISASSKGIYTDEEKEHKEESKKVLEELPVGFETFIDDLEKVVNLSILPDTPLDVGTIGMS